jgi:hypothetical protein
MAEIARGVGLLFPLETEFVPQSKIGLAVRPKVKLGPEPFLLVIKGEMGSPLRPQSQRGAAGLLIPQVQPDLTAVSAQVGPHGAVWVAHREGRNGQERAVRAEERIGHNDQDNPHHPQDKGLIKFPTPVLMFQSFQALD